MSSEPANDPFDWSGAVEVLGISLGRLLGELTKVPFRDSLWAKFLREKSEPI